MINMKEFKEVRCNNLSILTTGNKKVTFLSVIIIILQNKRKRDHNLNCKINPFFLSIFDLMLVTCQRKRSMHLWSIYLVVLHTIAPPLSGKQWGELEFTKWVTLVVHLYLKCTEISFFNYQVQAREMEWTFFFSCGEMGLV